MSYNNNNREQREPANYLRASSVTKTVHDNRQQGKKTRVEYTFDETEETSYTLTHEKANDLINRLQAAMNDESGTGGVRISMYGRRSENKHTGEVFDGLGILVYAQKPAPEGGQRRGGYQQRGNGGGRRSYPQQGAGRSQNQGSRPSGNGGSNYGGKPANSGTQQSGQRQSGQSTGRTTGGQGGRTQDAQSTASRSDNDYQEQPDF